MRGFIAGVVTVIVIALISGFILLRSGLIPANADGKPDGLELWAADTSLTAIGLDLKTVIDQLREQVQNIE